MNFDIQIDDSEAQRGLEDIRRLVTQTALVKGANAAAEVIAGTLATLTPEAEEGERNDEQPHLVDSIVTAVEVDSEGRGVVANVGFGKMGYVANFVEYGHRMVGHKPDKKELGKVNPKPFMRPAAEMAADPAVEAFRAAVEGVIDHGA